MTMYTLYTHRVSIQSKTDATDILNIAVDNIDLDRFYLAYLNAVKHDDVAVQQIMCDCYIRQLNAVLFHTQYRNYQASNDFINQICTQQYFTVDESFEPLLDNDCNIT